MNFYRFSISWSRVLPNGDITVINEKGIEYYNKLIDKIIENKLVPIATMFHFDLPLRFKKFGGFTNSMIINYFESYANLLFQRFGDRVKSWITINEPAIMCIYAYGEGRHPPALNDPGIADYLCGHNALKAHAVAYRLYRKLYYDQFKGQIGIALHSQFYYSDSNDTVAVNRALQFVVRKLKCLLFPTKYQSRIKSIQLILVLITNEKKQ